jgi:fructuronate reductase
VTARLNASSLIKFPAAVRIPDYDYSHAGIGIVHLGLGAFHRAHQAVYTEDAMRVAGGNWGIVGVAMRHSAVPDALARQDHLYSIEVLQEAVEFRVIGSIRESLTASRQGARLTAAIASPQTHLITMTVTEKGYCLGQDGELNLAHADIVHDLEHPLTPVSAIGWLALALGERARAHGHPITVISCDNLKSNGTRLEQALTAFVARTSPSLLPWLSREARFPKTVVDCIVPAASTASLARAAEALGFSDSACVQREAYSQWVIEDAFAGPRPAWERTGVQIVTDTTGFGRLKLHVLNTCHSALAYLGLPRGHTYVREAVADPELGQFLEQLVAQEIAPALAPLAVREYWQSVRARFQNPRIDHRLAQIAEDGAQKLAERVYPLINANSAAAAPIALLCGIVRAWLKFTATDVNNAFKDDSLLPASIREDLNARAAILDIP